MMRVIVKCFFVLLIYFCFLDSVSAMVCDSNKIAELRNYASNIEVTYEYFEKKISEEFVESYYDVYLTNVIDEFTLKYDGTYYSPVNGEFKFIYDYDAVNIDVYSSSCHTFIKTIKIELPWKNPYYDSDICIELKDKNLNVCEEWPDTPISEEEFNMAVDKYYDEVEDEYVAFSFVYRIINNPLYLGGILFVIFSILVIMIIKLRRRRLL